MPDTERRPIDTANRLAPLPTTEDESTPELWIKHYAAQALAFYAEFDTTVRRLPESPEQGCRLDVGYLCGLAVASMAAAVALTLPADSVGQHLWDLTPELGALNGEWEEWLVDILDARGINPADIDSRYEAADFKSPSRPVPATLFDTPEG